MRYLSVIESDKQGCSAFIPDLPGVVATGKDARAVLRTLSEALALHLESMREDNDPIPEPKTQEQDVELEPGEEVAFVEPAVTNPVSAEIRAAIRSSSLSQAEIARRMGVSEAAVSRLASRFYFGHSVSSLKALERALDLKLVIRFEQAA